MTLDATRLVWSVQNAKPEEIQMVATVITLISGNLKRESDKELLNGKLGKSVELYSRHDRLYELAADLLIAKGCDMNA
ncbi:hypothetical protein [Paenibacillus apiarius]|uniref:Uncharacterized protein n=1 Tax=Paenibacillus apiarius TaxID=46240 RepID=A0ABT4DVK5_9BACL|nr:hypothetical protein [Paenibacillus apiarius]MCY9513272.1 hypothetical protein [Paenibacillus apiarius]MCY9521369.1 hypothetical protein [Paenibacillus apiarius]MCY9554485.1 hypothetical protein [Paenibacillus apiarius]MCY9560688.1 hypothetical protein [Paenibacillus apiarius]MCY9685061.1 hypothetical protein [Paenibacillus apiarius]